MCGLPLSAKLSGFAIVAPVWEEVPKMGPRKFCREVSLSQRSQGTKRDYSDQLAKEGRRQKSQDSSKSRQRLCAWVLRLTWENSFWKPWNDDTVVLGFLFCCGTVDYKDIS